MSYQARAAVGGLWDGFVETIEEGAKAFVSGGIYGVMERSRHGMERADSPSAEPATATLAIQPSTERINWLSALVPAAPKPQPKQPSRASLPPPHLRRPREPSILPALAVAVAGIGVAAVIVMRARSRR